MKQIVFRYGLFLSVLLSINIVVAQTTISEYNAKAKQAYDKQDYDGVVNAATLSLNVALNGEAYWWRALGYFNKKNYELSVSDYTKAITFYQNSKSSLATLYFLRGEANMNRYKYEDAAIDFEDALYNQYNDKKKVYKYLITIAEKRAIPEYALKFYDDLIAMETNNNELSALYYSRAILKSGMLKYKNDQKSILTDLNLSIEKNGQNHEAYFTRGQIQLLKKEYDLSRADFAKCATLLNAMERTKVNISKLSNSYFGIGYSYYELKKYEDAKINYFRSIDYDSTNAYVYWNLARIFSFIDKKYNDAAIYFQKALRFYLREDERASCMLDFFTNECNNLKLKSALEISNRGIAYNPKNAIFHWDKGYILQLKGDWQGSLQSFDKALSLGIKDTLERSSCLLQRGLLKMKMNDAQGALLDIQQSIALKPAYDNYMALGKLFKNFLKQNEIANGNFQKAMNYVFTDVQRKDTTSNYAYAAAAMGDRRTAERFIKKMIVDASAKVGALTDEYHNAACIYTTLGDVPKALEYLELSLQSGYTDFYHMLHDADLEPLYKLPEYKNLLVKYKVPTPVY